MVLHPVGPLPASTYWRRRLVLLVALVVLLLVLRSCVGGGGGATPAGRVTPTPTPTATSTPTPKPSPTRAAGPVTCPDRVLALTATPSSRTAPAGSTVRFTLNVKNTGSVACRRDLGDAALEVLVYSGNDRIWSSDDCSTDNGHMLTILQPGGALEHTVSWPGKRSASGCPKDEPTAKAGTYTVRARVGTLRSAVGVFRLTGSST